jgi:putative transposase
MRLLDEQYTRTPFYGIKKMTAWLRTQGQEVNHKRVARLLRQMGLMAVYPKPRLSQPGEQIARYPYLLRGLTIERNNQVWSTDITSIRADQEGSSIWWQLSTGSAALSWPGKPPSRWKPPFAWRHLTRHFRTRSQRFSTMTRDRSLEVNEFVNRLKAADVRSSWDGRGRALDNIFVERLWRSVKYEEVYLKDYQTIRDAENGLKDYFQFYNQERLHQSLKYQTPAQVYYRA